MRRACKRKLRARYRGSQLANPGDEDEAGLALETSSSDDDGELDPGRDLRAGGISIPHLLSHQPKNRYCKTCTYSV